MSDNKTFAPCQVKFAFDVMNNHPLSHYDFFGFKDEFDMANAHFENLFKDDEQFEFNGIDCSGAKLTIVFETTYEDFNSAYKKATQLLESINSNPEYNTSDEHYNQCLETLIDEGIIIMDNEPNSKVFEEFNKIIHGTSDYLEYYSSL